MGRKIPGKKHRGIKDPSQQRADREARVAHTVNAPPQHPDEQKVPRSLTDLIALKRLAKERPERPRNRHGQKRRGRREADLAGEVPPNPRCRVSKRDQRDFHRKQLRELTLKAKEKMRQAQYETKFGVKLIKNREGEFVAKKCPTGAETLANDRVGNLKKAGKKIPTSFQARMEVAKKSSKKGAGKEEEKVSQRRAERKNGKGKSEDSDECDILVRDHVQFREVVHEPPTLIAPKKIANSRSANMAEGRPGRKELLLKRLLDGSASTHAKGKVPVPVPARTKAPAQDNARRVFLEAERCRVVELYRSLKAHQKISL